MKRNTSFFYLFMIRFLSKKYLIINFFLCFCIIILILFQSEIILYFYPDLLLIELNNLVESEVHVVIDNVYTNNFNNKGYIFFNPDYMYKSLLLSNSLNLYKYKRFIQLYTIIDRDDDAYSKILLKNKKYPLSLQQKYLTNLYNRFMVKNKLLWKNLLENSTYLQKLKLQYAEYYENLIFRRRAFERKATILRDVIHAYPGNGTFNDAVMSAFFDMDTKEQLEEDLKLYDYWDSAPRFTYFNIYKKFSYYIYKNYFFDRIEPYKFYRQMMRRRSQVPYIIEDYRYLFQKHAVSSFEKNPLYEPNVKFIVDILYDPVEKDHEMWEQLVDYSEANLQKFTKYDKVAVHGFTREWIDPYIQPDIEGFVTNKKTLSTVYNKRPHKDPMNFCYFYDEKGLYDEIPKFDYLRLISQEYRWDVAWGNNNNRNDDNFKYDMSFSDLNRANYWFYVFPYYRYIMKDYFFFNPTNEKNYFKKIYIPYQDEWFFFPKFYRLINFFYRFFFFFYKIFNFFIINENELNEVKNNKYNDNNVNIYNFNFININFLKYGIFFPIFVYIIYIIKTFFFFCITLLYKILLNLINFFIYIFMFIYNKYISHILLKIFNIFFRELVNKIIDTYYYYYGIYIRELTSFNNFLKDLEQHDKKKYEALTELYKNIMSYFVYIRRPYFRYKNRFYLNYDYYINYLRKFLYKFDLNFYMYFFYDIYKQITFFKFLGFASISIRVFLIKLFCFGLIIYLYTIIISRFWRSYDSEDDIYNLEFFIVIMIGFYVWCLLALNLPLLIPFL